MAEATDPPTETEPDSQLSEAELEEQEVKASHNLFRGLISLGILVALAVGLLLAVPGLHGVAKKVVHMNGWWLALAIFLEILSCLGYVLAFLQVFDRAPIRLGARVALTEQAFGVAVSLGGVGSAAIGAVLLMERGGPRRRVAELSAVLFLLTSAVNVVTLAVVGLGLWTGLLPGPRNPLLSLLPGMIGVVVLVGFLAMPRIADRYIDLEAPGKLRAAVRETSTTIRETEHKLFTRDWRVLGSYGYLWFDIGVLAACFAAAGKVPPLATVVLAYQIGYMVNVIPIPGNIGILDGSIVGMFVLYGINGTLVTAATIVYHAIALWIPATWGTIAFLILRRSRGEPLQLRPPREERLRLRRARRA